MQREPNIVWRKSQQEKLTRSVAKFNAKITRELKKNSDLAEFLPSKLNTKTLKESIKTNKDLGKLVKSVDRAFKKDVFAPVSTKGGIKTTQYEINEAKLKVRQINRERAVELKKANPSTERGTMGLMRDVSLQPKKFDIDKMSNKEWEKFKRWAEKQTMSSFKQGKMEMYKNNYLVGISNTFGEGSEIFNRFSAIPADKLVELYYKDPVFSIDFIYDPIELERRQNELMAHLEYEGF